MINKKISLLGSTGSIGRQTIQVAGLFSDRVQIEAITGHSNAELLIRQAKEVKPSLVVVTDSQAFQVVRDALVHDNCRVRFGKEGLIEAVSIPQVDTVVAAIVGRAGLEPVLAAAREGKRIALANKEALVVGGGLVLEAARTSGSSILPVDSEHSAIFQCLTGEDKTNISRLILTASGGPFRDRAATTFADITLAEALAHPNWSMGKKISIDSATMMNKGLEVIEAHWLFDVPTDKIDVVIHRESVVHSMVEFVDGSYKAQLGHPDMRIPIQYALSFPQRWSTVVEPVDFGNVGKLSFENPSPDRYPCLALAIDASREGGTMPTVLNAANEVAVELFLNENLPFTGISEIVLRAMAEHETQKVESVEQLITVDSAVRSTILEQNNLSFH